MTRLSLAVIAAGAIALVNVGAASAAPPCPGSPLTATDATGDGHHSNADVVRTYFRTDGTKTSANLVIPDLDSLAPQHGASAQSGFYRMLFTHSGTRYWVAAYGKADDTATYDYGRFTGTTAGDYDDIANFPRDGSTTGAVVRGVNGVVQIDLPAALGGGVEGALLKAPLAVTGDIASGTGFPPKPAGQIDFYNDTAPGGEQPTLADRGADHVVLACGKKPGVTSPAAVTGVTIGNRARTLGYRKAVRISGRVSPARAGVPVSLVVSDLLGDRVIARATTTAGGTFSKVVRLRRGAKLHARVGTLDSATVAFKVRSVVRMRIERTLPGVLFSGRVHPDRSGRVRIELRSGRQWIEVADGKVRRRRFLLRMPSAERGRYRVVFSPRAGSGRIAATSASRRLRGR